MRHFSRDCTAPATIDTAQLKRNDLQPTVPVRVYAMTPANVETKSESVTGKIPIFRNKATIWFDSETIHSFMSSTRTSKVVVEPFDVEIAAAIPVGSIVVCKCVVRGCLISIKRRTLPADMVMFQMQGFDVIL